MRSIFRSSKRDTWNTSSSHQEGKKGQSQKPPSYGIGMADSGPQSIRAFRDFTIQQNSPGFRESKDKSFHPDSQYQLRPADDAYEQQADRLAEKIMTQQPVEEPVKKLNPPSTTPNRKQEGEGVKTEVGQKIKAARGKGSPLPEVIRRPAEKALGKDLSRVRLHTGARAERINQSINAEAAAVNQDIFATRRAADVHSPQSRAILLHETVHTLQQNSGNGTHSDKGSIQPFSIKNAYERFKNLFRRRRQRQPGEVAALPHPPAPALLGPRIALNPGDRRTDLVAPEIRPPAGGIVGRHASASPAEIHGGQAPDANSQHEENTNSEHDIVNGPQLKDVRVNGKTKKVRYGPSLNKPVFSVDESPSVEDIKQGGLGDCYLLAALISVVNAEGGAEMIKGMFDEETGNENTVKVKFFSFGQYGQNEQPKAEWVEINKSLPVFEDDGKLAYAQGPKTWPVLIEKAYAKWGKGKEFLGGNSSGFAGIEAGHGHHAIAHLTGRKTHKYDISKDYNSNDLYKRIHENLQNHEMVTLGTRPGPQLEEELQTQFKREKVGPAGEVKIGGLAAPHEYAVVRTKEGKRGKKYVYVRNPWGEYGRKYQQHRVLPDNVKIKKGEDGAVSKIEAAELPKFFGAMGYSERASESPINTKDRNGSGVTDKLPDKMLRRRRSSRRKNR